MAEKPENSDIPLHSKVVSVELHSFEVIVASIAELEGDITSSLNRQIDLLKQLLSETAPIYAKELRSLDSLLETIFAQYQLALIAKFEDVSDEVLLLQLKAQQIASKCMAEQIETMFERRSVEESEPELRLAHERNLHRIRNLVKVETNIIHTITK